MNLEIEKKNHNEEQNPYLLLGFWEFFYHVHVNGCFLSMVITILCNFLWF